MDTQIHVYVPTEELEILDSKLQGRSRSTVIRKLIADYNRGRLTLNWSE